MKQKIQTANAPGAPGLLSQAIVSNWGEAVCVKALPLGASIEISLIAEK